MTVDRSRVAIVGAPASFGTTSPWIEAELPNVVDYEAAILDMRSLGKGSGAFTIAGINKFRGLLQRLLESGGQVIAIIDDPLRPFNALNPGQPRLQSPVTASSLLPIGINPVAEAGKTLSVASSKFERYLQHVKTWNFHFTFTINSENEVYLRNRERKWLAGEHRVGSAGRLVILPNGEFADPAAAIAMVLEEITGTAVRAPIPQWASTLQIPGVAALELQATEAQRTIEKLTADVKSFEAQANFLNQYRQLVYSEGSELENIVAQSFRLLGGDIVPQKYGTEEYLLVYEGREHLIEVKGVINSAALKHVRQLMDNQMIAEEQTGAPTHGILVANTWRNDPPSQRGQGDLVEFPPNVITRASANDMALLSSRALFAAVCAKLDNRDDGIEFMHRITSGVGVISV